MGEIPWRFKSSLAHQKDLNAGGAPKGTPRVDQVLSRSPSFGTLGQLAQLVEHLVYTEEVIGSSPILPTIIYKCYGLECWRRDWRRGGVESKISRF